MNKLSQMISLVAQKFENKTDKAGQPYVLHCIRVMQNTRSTDQERLMIGAGHDLLEDTDVTVKYLRDSGFSERVINGILALTKMPGQTYEEYLQGVSANPDAVIVKLADLEDNSDIRRLKGITEKDIQRMKKYHAAYTFLKGFV